MSPTILLLSILPRSMAAGLSPRYEKFGYALSVGNGGFGFLAGVFFHRVDELVAWRGQDKASRGVLLGHMMAHEIGHLLLGQGSHARTGIMRCPWSAEELKAVAAGTLLFTPKQARRIRGQVRARISAHARAID